MLRIKLKKIINRTVFFFKKLPRFLSENSFIAILFFVFLLFILAGLVFYKYSFLVEKKELEVLEESPFVNEKTFQEIIEIWQKREKKFKEAELKIYPNPFLELTR